MQWNDIPRQDTVQRWTVRPMPWAVARYTKSIAPPATKKELAEADAKWGELERKEYLSMYALQRGKDPEQRSKKAQCTARYRARKKAEKLEKQQQNQETDKK